MSLTPSQTKHLTAIAALADESGEPVTRTQLLSHLFGHRRRSNPSLSRAVNALAEAQYITLVPGQDGDPDEYRLTDAGRAAAATGTP